MIKFSGMRWAGHVMCGRDYKCIHNFSQKPEGKRSHRISRCTNRVRHPSDVDSYWVGEEVPCNEIWRIIAVFTILLSPDLIKSGHIFTSHFVRSISISSSYFLMDLLCGFFPWGFSVKMSYTIPGSPTFENKLNCLEVRELCCCLVTEFCFPLQIIQARLFHTSGSADIVTSWIVVCRA